MRFEKVATPATAFTVTVPPSVAPGVPPARASVTAPVNALAGSPAAVCAAIVTGVSLAPAVALPGCAVTASFAAASDLAVAVYVRGDPASVPAEAETVCVPTVLPSCQVLCASPASVVTAVALPTEPPPLVTANVTVTPPTPSPSLAVTNATSGFARVLPTRPL